MGDFETAARDPIFFAHHGNLDRLWETWRRDPAHKATEPTSSAFLDHAFPFIWLDGSVIQVPMRDLLDTQKLGYVYDNLDVFRPGAPVAVAAAQAASDSLPSVGTSKLKVPFSAQGAADENERKILEITDVAAPTTAITVGVYLKTPQTPPDEMGVNVGAFSAVLAGGKVAWPSKTLSFDITDAAKKFAGQEITVDLIPYRIRAEGVEESYPKIKYGGMRIVTEK
ncbi:MAG: tyrosinase family protein [Beijerinckiaceae bacterium]|nr:tyrosinase family protein [Beijerinckiaceae bacterium]